MTIPKDLTAAEVGAFLLTIGEMMLEEGVAAQVLLDEAPLDEEKRLISALAVAFEVHRVLDGPATGFLLSDARDELEMRCDDRAAEIVGTLTLQEAIEFNPADV